MKKKILALVMATISAFSFLTACGKNEPEFFYMGFAYEISNDFFSESEQPTGTAPSNELKERVENIFETLCKQYDLQKELPKIEVLTRAQAEEFWGSTEDFGDLAQYNNGVLYLIEESHDGVIAHELCHYLSDNGKLGGLFYQTDNVILGRYLNEGVTNYFSTKIFPHNEYYTIYEYETHIARILSIAYGEENLKNAFFSGNPEELRVDINECLQKYYDVYSLNNVGIPMYAFEAMATSLDTFSKAYAYTLQEFIAGQDYREDMTLSLTEAQSVEEMLVFYAREKGAEEEVKEEIEQFLNTSVIPFNFKELF